MVALRALGILDTPPEQRFDRISRLAQRMFDVPIALISLVDTNRQWFKSCIGLDLEETPRSVSFCAHAILGDDALVIPDARLDPRFADNPLVTGDPHARFYDGQPLVGPNHQKIGTLCVLDRRPRRMGDDDLAALRDRGQRGQAAAEAGRGEPAALARPRGGHGRPLGDGQGDGGGGGRGVSAGDALIVPANAVHQIETVGETEAEWLLAAPAGVRFLFADGREASPPWAK